MSFTLVSLFQSYIQFYRAECITVSGFFPNKIHLPLLHSRFPNHSKRLIKKGMYKELENVMSKNEFEKHFSPRYDPLKQRFCLAPDGDFFAAIRSKQRISNLSVL